MKIFIIDPISEKGHFNFNNKIISQLSSYSKIKYHSILKNDFIEYLDLLSPFCKRLINLNIRIKYFLYLNYLIKTQSLEDYDKILFLAYETISFSLAANMLFYRNIYIIEHNNIDQIQNSWIKYIYFRAIPSNIKHIVFEKYIVLFLRREFNKKTYYYPHPIIEKTISNKTKSTNVVFAPSLSNNKQIADKLINYISKNKKFELIMKGSDQIEFPNIVIKPFFNNYFDNIRNAKFVFIGSLFNYRVSGVAIDSLALKTPIIGFKCRLMIEMKKKYPSLVFIIENIDELNSIALNKNNINGDYDKFIQLHNDDEKLYNILQYST